MVIMVASVVLAAWSAANHDVPLALSAWRDNATVNANKQLNHQVAIRDMNTQTLVTAQAKAQPMQKRYGMGELMIPAVNIDLTIYSVVTDNTLATGVARYFPDRPMGQGNNVYAAHNMDGAGGLLAKISTLKKQAIIRQTDFKHVYQYRVVYNRVIKMTEVAVLKQTDEQRITLIRCEGPAHTPYRRVVIARLQKVSPYRATGAKTNHALSRAQSYAAALFNWQNTKWQIGLLLLIFILLLGWSCRGYYRDK